MYDKYVRPIQQQYIVAIYVPHGNLSQMCYIHVTTIQDVHLYMRTLLPEAGISGRDK